MIAYSRVPPLVEENLENAQYEFPIESIITVDAINQTNQKKKPHIITNPNLASVTKKETIDMEEENLMDKKSEKKIEQFSNKEKDLSNDNGQTMKEENLQSSNAVEINHRFDQIEQEKPIENEKEPEKQLSLHNEDEGKLPLETVNKNSPKEQQINEEQFKEMSHIIFSPPSQNLSTIWHKKPIFSESHEINQIIQENFVESIFKPNEQEIEQKIVQNIDIFIKENQEEVEQHIECTLFGNSEKEKRIPYKNECETSHKDFYDSYCQNRSKIKYLGGKKSSKLKKESELNLNHIKIEVTKMISIKPVTF